MTVTNINTPERLDRISALMKRSQTLHYDQACQQVDGEMAAEAEVQAERDVKTRELTGSYSRMMVCPVLGCGGNMLGNPGGLCDRHSRIANKARVERAAAQVVNGRTEQDLVEAWLDQTGGWT